ncbi:FxLYD domain-containing protein [Kitasatospora sp. NPDC054939]
MDRHQPRRTTTPPRTGAPVRTTVRDTAAPVVRRPRRAVAGALAAVALGAAALAGCSSDGSPSSPAATSAASAVQSALQSGLSAAASAAASAVQSAAGGLSSAAASAQAAASSAIAGIKGGLDAKGDVTLGPVAAASDGRLEVPLTVNNQQQQANRYTVQVNFTDQSGNLLDAVVVNVPDVPAGQSAQATARSNRELSGDVKAVVANAVRY